MKKNKKYYVEICHKDYLSEYIMQSDWFDTKEQALDYANKITYLEDIYLQISSYYPSQSPSKIRNAIKYVLDNRNETLCKKNFEKIFGFEYDEIYFETKNFIEELVNLIKFQT